jgi:hypothetical protein
MMRLMRRGGMSSMPRVLKSKVSRGWDVTERCFEEDNMEAHELKCRKKERYGLNEAEVRKQVVPRVYLLC